MCHSCRCSINVCWMHEWMNGNWEQTCLHSLIISKFWEVVWDKRKPWFWSQSHWSACQIFLYYSPAVWIPKECTAQSGTLESDRKVITSQSASYLAPSLTKWPWTPYNPVALVTCLGKRLNLWISISLTGKWIFVWKLPLNTSLVGMMDGTRVSIDTGWNHWLWWFLSLGEESKMSVDEGGL